MISLLRGLVIAVSNPSDWNLNPDALLWWKTTHPILWSLLAYGGYSWRQRVHALKFYHTYIVPNLGSFPRAGDVSLKWQSFMTDDFSPIEFSWNWGNSHGVVDRRVRFSIEAISDESGTITDPWNQRASLDLVDRLQLRIPDMNVEWFHRLLKDFTPTKESFSEATLSLFDSQRPRSSIFLAFELRDEMPVVKAYFLPFAKAMETSQPGSAVILRSLATFAQEVNWSSLERLTQALEMHKLLGIDPFMIAFDCVAPKQSRMKIYARCPDIRLVSVEEVMSLFEDTSKIANGIKDLRKLWGLLFGCDSASGDSAGNLTYKAHLTSGILYYFEVRPESPKITTKVYLPVRHYAENDLSVAKGLQTFFKDRGGKQDQIARDFMKVLDEICSYRRLDSATGLQTYISCKIEKDSLELTSYLSPEIYHEGRWASGDPAQ
ncbi:dimethylallyl tryptophan synthase protein [Rutstroemia sp. NJR-2017a BVV2]|nr:dimethylallyl tryptophan synthase protein [Rutstroemia sp. NJR-2017a BVV2]